MSDSIETKHAEVVRATIKPGENILLSLSAHDCHILHDALGLAGEVGELVDALKKHIIYRKPLDTENVIEELGDIEYFLQDLRARLGISRGLTLQNNCNKLERRYPGLTYSDQAAQNRADKD